MKLITKVGKGQFEMNIIRDTNERLKRFQKDHKESDLEFNDILFYDGDIDEDKFIELEKETFRTGFKKAIITN